MQIKTRKELATSCDLYDESYDTKLKIELDEDLDEDLDEEFKKELKRELEAQRKRDFLKGVDLYRMLDDDKKRENWTFRSKTSRISKEDRYWLKIHNESIKEQQELAEYEWINDFFDENLKKIKLMEGLL